MRIISGYIRRSVIQSVLLCFLTLSGVQCFIKLIDISGDIGKGSLTLWTGMLYVLMRLPADLYQMFPMVGFVGCLLGLGRLSSNSELIIIRSSGVSIARIALSVVSAASILIVFITFMGEVIAPPLTEAAQYLKHPEQRNSALRLQDVWLHQGNTFLSVGHVKAKHYVQDLRLFDFDDNHHMTQFLKASEAHKTESGWVLKDVDVLKINAVPSRLHFASYPLNMTIQPDMLVKKKIDLRNESAFYLWDKFHYLKKVGLDQGQTTFVLWQHLMQPFTTIVMICLGVPFTLGSLRDSSGSTRSVIGVLVGFGFYMLNEFLGPMAFIYHVPAVLAATLPSLLFLFCYMMMLRRID